MNWSATGGDITSGGLFHAGTEEGEFQVEAGFQGLKAHTSITISKDTPPPKPPEADRKPRRFHGTVALDPSRTGRDAGRIGEEIISHLAGIVDATVKVTLEIDAEVPSGVPDHVVRTVTENSRTLKFSSHGFEEE